jgi:hypothetical protein
MSDDGRDRYELPSEMRSMAETSFEQARQGFEKFGFEKFGFEKFLFEKILAGAQATAGSIEPRGATVRAGARDIGASSAEANVLAWMMRRRCCTPGPARGDTAVQRICPGANAVAGGTGRRNGAARQPGRVEVTKPKS